MADTTPPFKSNRPHQKDPETLLAAARVLGARMGVDCDSEDAHESIASALKEDSAYDMAKHLDTSCGWIIDDSILEVLVEGAFLAVLTANRDRVSAWVHQNGIRPQKAVGDKVSVAYRGTLIDGTVTNVNETEATYTVNSPQLGHVRPGEMGQNGIIVPFESIHSLVQAPEDFTLQAQSLTA
jgi:hypothetical protein